MRRILVMMTVVALMVVMLAMSVAPAFAAAPLYQCIGPNGELAITPAFNKHFLVKQGYECVRLPR